MKISFPATAKRLFQIFDNALVRRSRALDSIKEKYDRIVVVTDEQSHDRMFAPKCRDYIVNVASAKNGVGYGSWSHIDRWSEAVIEYIRELQQSEAH